jgi:HEPN domain-containing protein
MAELDIQKQIQYWRNGAQEAFDAAQDLVNRDHRILFGLFFVHLALEKALKAHVCLTTRQMPPRIHNLNRLMELAQLPVDDEVLTTASAMNEFNLEGRYPENWMTPPTLAEAQDYLEQSKKVFEWLMSRL